MFQKAVNGLRAGFKEAVASSLAWMIFVPLWPYVFVIFRKKVVQKDRALATWLAAGGVACDIVIATGFRLDWYLMATVAAVAYGALTWPAYNVQMDK